MPTEQKVIKNNLGPVEVGGDAGQRQSDMQK